MPSVFDGNTHDQVFVSLALVAGVIASGCSALVIVLIHRMRVWNLHIALILGMTLFELLYDVSFFTGMVNTGSFPLAVSSNLAQLLGGTTSSLISNVIAGVALYVIFFKRSVDMLPYYSMILISTIIPGIVVCILYILSVSNSKYHGLADFAVLGLYYYIRLVSICINFICSICTASLIHRMSSSGARRTKPEVAIRKLSLRLFYYPIIQAIGRSGCAWYEMSYKYNFDPTTGFNFNPPDTTNAQFAAQCLMVLSTPLTSIGYLCFFVIMQPHAKRTLIELLSSIGICETLCCIDQYDGATTQPLLGRQQQHDSSDDQLSVTSCSPSVCSTHSIQDFESAISSSSRMPSVDTNREDTGAYHVNLFEYE